MEVITSATLPMDWVDSASSFTAWPISSTAPAICRMACRLPPARSRPCSARRSASSAAWVVFCTLCATSWMLAVIWLMAVADWSVSLRCCSSRAAPERDSSADWAARWRTFSPASSRRVSAVCRRASSLIMAMSSRAWAPRLSV